MRPLVMSLALLLSTSLNLLTSAQEDSSEDWIACAKEASWNRIDGGPFISVGISNPGRIMGVGFDNSIWQLPPGKPFYRLPGALVQADVAHGNLAAGVTWAEDIFTWRNKRWDVIAGKAIRASITPLGEIWVVNRCDDIFWGDLRNSTFTWTNIPGKARSITAGSSRTVYVVNSAGNAYNWDGAKWNQVGGLKFRRLEASKNGDRVVALNFEGRAFAHRWSDSTWHPLGDMQFQEIAIGRNAIVGMNAEGELFRRCF